MAEMTRDSARNKAPASFEPVLLLPLGALKPNPRNPRKQAGAVLADGLVESIRKHGVIEPIVARRIGDGYEIIAGERRWRASHLACKFTIPTRVLEGIDDRTALELALVENLQRRDLDPIEEAQGYAALVELGIRQKEIAERVNRSQESISNAMRLLKLPEPVKESISEGTLTASHGKALLSYEDNPALMEIQTKRAIDGATTREIEKPDHKAMRGLIEAGKAIRIGWCGDGSVKGKCAKGCNKRRRVDQQIFCLDPDCWHAEQEEQRAAAIAEMRQKYGIPQDRKVVDFQKAQGASYQAIFGKLPAGCKGHECEHLVVGMRSYGPEVSCTDAKCYRKLSGAKDRESRPVIKGKFDGLVDLICERLDAAEGPDMRKAAALVVNSALINGVPVDIVKAVLERTDTQVETNLIADRTGGVNRLSALAAITPEHLIRVVAEMLVRKQAKLAVDCEHYVELAEPILKWFLEASGPQQADDEQPTGPAPVAAQQKAPPAMAYLDSENQRYFVGQGLGKGDDPWMTFRTNPGKTAMHRVTSPALPPRVSAAEAQADLDEYARKRGLWAAPAEEAR